MLGLLMSLFAQDISASQWESPLGMGNACIGVYTHITAARAGGTRGLCPRSSCPSTSAQTTPRRTTIPRLPLTSRPSFAVGGQRHYGGLDGGSQYQTNQRNGRLGFGAAVLLRFIIRQAGDGGAILRTPRYF